MRVYVVGLPGSGRETIFRALTGLPPSPPGAGEVRQGEAAVKDARLDSLSSVYKPRKHTPAKVELFLPKFPGEPKEALRAALEKARDADCLLLVLRGFASLDPNAPDPAKDASLLESELKVADYLVVSKRLERLAEDKKRGKAPDPEEKALLEAALSALEAEKPLRTIPEIADSPKLRGYGLLSAKPALAVLNLPDEAGDSQNGLEKSLEGSLGESLGRLSLRGRLEEEFSRLEPEEAKELMGEYGLTELASSKVIRTLYELNKLISFFTVGDDECRAWTIKIGDAALEAAGKIHSDIRRGFIRAEVVSYADLAGSKLSMVEAKKKGLVRLEGKTYKMADGDVVLFRFNV